jgi:hypothetical protein
MIVILGILFGVSFIINILYFLKFRRVKKVSGRNEELRIFLNSLEVEIRQFRNKYGLNK